MRTMIWLAGWCLFGLVSGQLNVDLPAEYRTNELFRVKVDCNVTNYDGDPSTINYRWTFAGDSKFAQSTQTLTLSMVGRDRSGIYTCFAWQGDATSGLQGQADMELIVQFKPRWNYDLAVPKAATPIQGRVAIKCATIALPEPTFFWSRGGKNFTSNAAQKISSNGYVSTLVISNTQESDYGAFTCNAFNAVGSSSFVINLVHHRIPDGPRSCTSMNASYERVTIRCVGGFDGGASLTYPVMETGARFKTKLVESTMKVEENGMVMVTVTEVHPGYNYTLMVYQENEFGRSETSAGVFVRVPPAPPNTGGKSVTPQNMFIIIGATVGGVVVLAIIIAVAVFCACRRNKKQESQPRIGSSTRKDTQAYVMEDEQNKLNNTQQAPSDDHLRASKRSGWGSFKSKRTPRALQSAGASQDINTPEHHNRRGSQATVADYTSQPFVVNLDHNPGETSIDAGFDNPNYTHDTTASGSEETSFYENLTNKKRRLNPAQRNQELERRREMAEPSGRARAQAQDQPGLAGFGALNSALVAENGMGPTHSTPLKRPVRSVPGKSEVPGNVKRQPSFQPEVPWEFNREKLYVRDRLGAGSFGEVWKARAEGILGRPGMVVVAVKMLKEYATAEERRALCKELDIMKLLQPHPNIVQLLGCCTITEPQCIIMEYASRGSLQDLLRKQRLSFEMNDLSQDHSQSINEPNVDLTVKHLMLFGLHIASGMEYIASRSLLHRDLAARNILVSEDLVCKICDFGSSRDIVEVRQYESKTQNRLPIRWMAPESLFQCTYTTESDVWAFGVILWEIITLGSSPYPGLSGPEVMQFIQKGCRMQNPHHCSDTLYSVMKDCWSQFPPRRPTFSILRHRMRAIVDEPTPGIYVEEMAENMYEIIQSLPGEKC